MSYLVRSVVRADIRSLEKLLTAYMQETYQSTWGGSVELLEQHITDNKLEILLAETTHGVAIGFVAWTSSYDLHWCMNGGAIIDLFVESQHRGRGLTLVMATDMAKKIIAAGGTYMKGGAVESQAVHRLYQRIAVRVCGDEYYVSGRAFRHLASLAGRTVREIARNLPETAWNYEP